MNAYWQCPNCSYDLQGQVAVDPHVVRCPECGEVWPVSALRPPFVELQSAGVKALLVTYGPSFVLPPLALFMAVIVRDLRPTAVALLLMLGIYCIIVCAPTTPMRRFRTLHVLVRACVLAMMNLMLAAVWAIGWMLLFLLIDAVFLSA